MVVVHSLGSEISDGVLDVFFDEVRIQRDRGGQAFAGGCDVLGARVVAFPAIHTPGTVVRPRRSKPSPRVHDGYEWLYVLSGRPGERMHVRAKPSGR